VWGPGYDNASGNLRLYMAQLRRKIEPDPARPHWFITEPGMGYRYQPPDEVWRDKSHYHRTPYVYVMFASATSAVSSELTK